MTTIIVLGVYWILAVVITYVVRSKNAKKHKWPFDIKQSLGEIITYNLLVWIIGPVVLPFAAVSLLYKTIRKRYNNKHNTHYPLDQVQGKGYEASLSDSEKTEIKNCSGYGVVKLSDYLIASDYTVYSEMFGNAILSGDFSQFETLFSNEAELILHSSKSFTGAKDICDYWKGWRERYVVTREIKEFEVLHSNYFGHSCLVMDNMMAVMYIRNEKIVKMILMRRNLAGGTYSHQIDDLVNDYPFSYSYIKRYLKPLRDDYEGDPVVKENRIPCFSCGVASENLEWHSSCIKTGIHGYHALVSICPKCGKVIEYYTEARCRLEEPVVDEYDMLEEYAKCWNGRSAAGLVKYLSDDFQYTSHWVLETLDKEGYLKYFSGKLFTIENTNSDVKARIIDDHLVVTQNGNNVVIDVKFGNNKIVSACMSPASFFGLPDKGIILKPKETMVPERVIELLENINSTNIFSAKGIEFHDNLLSSVIRTDTLKDKGEVFSHLTSLSLSEGLHLGLRLANPHTSDTGDESNFFVYQDNGKEDTDILKYLNVNQTAMSAWQVYLIMTAQAVMPVFWHGGYIVRNFIFKESDLDEIRPLNHLDLSSLMAQDILLPSVTIKHNDETGEFLADVYCCYWNEWRGLVREHAAICIMQNRAISFNCEDNIVLYKYDCGIFF